MTPAEQPRPPEGEHGLPQQLLDIVCVDHPGKQSRLLHELPADMGVVQTTPARRLGRLTIRVDGDHFEINLTSELHKAIVGAHFLMHPAIGDSDAKRFFNEGRPLLEGGRSDDQMVDSCLHSQRRQPFRVPAIDRALFVAIRSRGRLCVLVWCNKKKEGHPPPSNVQR
jgi:hypothetical protein